ncbi:MAG: ATP-binding protein [Halanaerobiales bacterium]|nr:ATP-binding protein [Halanaerobiales bacterium]
MLIRFSVENFLSFDKKQELTMLPAKRIRSKKEHIISHEKVSLLRTATIYGANASGKSNLVEAIRFAKFVVTKKLPINSTKKYCRAQKGNEKKATKFEFELYKNNKYYAYGFSLDLHNQLVLAEWLYELIPHKDKEKMLFERESQINRLELGSDIKLGEIDEMRFKVYKLDFEENKKSLFITKMNRDKKITSESKLSFFKDVYEWFDDDLITILPDQPITTFEYFYGDNCSMKIDEIIEAFDIGISKVKVHEITPVEFRKKIPSELANGILESFKNKLEEADDDVEEVVMSMRSNDVFFNFKGKKDGEIVITTIMLEHGSVFGDFEFSEESDGTRRLFDLLDILISNEKNKIYIVDEMERSLHPKLTYRFIELFYELLISNNVQLIFTTHESTIMTQELLRRDEIWFVERNKNNTSHLYSLDRFNERYDKKLSKAYLEGRYGAIPIFKKFSFEDGEC